MAKNIIHESSHDTIELTRQELADLFRVSPETIGRRTSDKSLNPRRVNSRVLRYGEDDIQSMIKMGYRLDPSRMDQYHIPSGLHSENTPSANTECRSGNRAIEADRSDLLLQLREHAKDPATRSLMLRFFASLILQDDLA